MFKWLIVLSVSCLLILGQGIDLIGQYPTEASAQSVNGSINQVGNQKILNLWGSYYEMGYAHGYLLADKIRDVIDTFLIGTVAGGNITRYTDFLAANAEFVTDYPEYLDEMNGMVAGMRASGKNLYVSSLRRNIDVRDIQALSLLAELYFHCSSFGVWGNATSGGETILARNFDFFYDPQGNIVNNQILITYEPTGKTRFVVFAWPGSIGITTGLNEYGISAMANMGNGENSGSAGPFHPSMEVLRYILENTTPANYWTQSLSLVNSTQEYSPFVIQLGGPYGGSQAPVYYLEDSPKKKAIRFAADVDPQYSHIIATNYFLKISPPLSSGSEVDRYNILRNGLINLYQTGDGKVSSPEAWSLLDSVADYDQTTLMSVVIRPNRMEFDVSFATLVDDDFTRSTAIPPQTYTWASLFPNHGPALPFPDLVVKSITASPAYPGPGQLVYVTLTVKNTGSDAAGAFRIDFYKNMTSAPTLRQYGDASCIKGSLAAGAADSCTFTVTYSAAGSYKMWAQVDSDQQVAELNETNNVFGPQTITVSNPDLILSSLTAVSTAKACQTIYITDTTKNTGQNPAGASTTKFYWSKNSTYDSTDSYLGSRSVGPLAAGAYSSGSTSIKIPCGIATGTYYIIGIADGDNVVVEGNETNNSKNRAIIIQRY
jgi:hypothetical protein